jgi:hypothetical protein
VGERRGMERVAGLLRLFGGFETQVFFDDLRHVVFSHSHEPKTFRPDHHVGAEGTNIQAAAADDADFAFEVAFFADLSQFFDDFFRAVIAAGFAFALAVVDANVKLPHIGLPSFDHENSLRNLKFKHFYNRKRKPMHAFLPLTDFVAAGVCLLEMAIISSRPRK